jgi:hypothetical protein
MASKLFKRVGTKKEMHLILMRVVSLDIPVKETARNIKIEWKRGNLRLESKKSVELTPECHACNI